MDRTPQVIVIGPRCPACGARLRRVGEPCEECGTKVAPQPDIVVIGVGQNFGTVNNVYNFAPRAPEVVDLRDVQDRLNERFPERVPVRAPERDLALLSPGPGKVVRVLNGLTYFLLVIMLLWAGVMVFAVLR